MARTWWAMLGVEEVVLVVSMTAEVLGDGLSGGGARPS